MMRSRVSHEQNLILPHVALDDVPALYDELAARRAGHGECQTRHRHHRLPRPRLLRAGNGALDPDCAAHFRTAGSPERTDEIGPLSINISGCINACGHHHVGHIGILGLEKGGVESYQITLGGSADENCSLGELAGPGFTTDEIVDFVEILVDTYLELRSDKAEDFLATYRRVGMAPFKKALYERFQGNAI